jgi:hypothetical protein
MEGSAAFIQEIAGDMPIKYLAAVSYFSIS